MRRIGIYFSLVFEGAKRARWVKKNKNKPTSRNWLFPQKIDKKRKEKKAHASLDSLKSSNEKLVSNLERPKQLDVCWTLTRLNWSESRPSLKVEVNYQDSYIDTNLDKRPHIRDILEYTCWFFQYIFSHSLILLPLRWVLKCLHKTYSPQVNPCPIVPVRGHHVMGFRGYHEVRWLHFGICSMK